MTLSRREDCIDVEVRASGLTKQMEKDLLIEMGFEDEEEEKEDNDDDSENETYKDCIGQNFEDLETQIKDLQLQVESAMKEQFHISTKKTLNNEYEHPEEVTATSHSEKQNSTEGKCKRNDETTAAEENAATVEERNEPASCDLSSTEIEVHNTQEESALGVKDEIVFDKDCFDTRSMWSASTTSTIAPEVIKRRIKLTLDKRDKNNQSRKIAVKGEASAVTRARRDNRATIKESTGIWGWE